MVVRLRLARHGTRNNPFYHVVAIRDKASRDARPIEKLGEYDPIPRPKVSLSGSSGSSSGSRSISEIPDRVTSSGISSQNVQLEKRLEWNAMRLQYWLGVGAQPSKTVAKLLDRAGLIPEGKSYKGIYRSPSSVASITASSPFPTASPSAILQAVGALREGENLSDKPLKGAAEAALKEEETSGPLPDRTNSKEEALKEGIAEASIDQAA